MSLVLIADNENKANALEQINFENVFDQNGNLFINDDTKKIANLFPFIYTIENWQQSGLNIFSMHPLEHIEYNVIGCTQGIVLTDKQCRDYQKLNHIDISDIFKNTKYEKIVQQWLDYLNTWYDIQENEAASFMIMSTINPMQEHIYNICKKYHIENTNIKERSKIFKYIHTNIRLTSCKPEGGYYNHEEYLHMQYIQDLLNRRVYINIDDKEQLLQDLKLRLFPPPGFRWLYLNEENKLCGDTIRYSNELQYQMEILMQKVVDNVKASELISFDQFWATRANSMPSGAATGYKYKDMPLDKRAAHELGLIQKEEVLDINTIVYASASMKYENGKNRYLYSTDVLDQTRTDYILSIIDKHLHVLNEAGMGLNQTQELKQEIKLSQCAIERQNCISFDYEDYNNQHTYDYMMYFWMSIATTLQKRFGNLAKNYIEIINIKIKTLQNRFIGKLGQDSYVAKSIHTLLSGSRETATLNGFNNISYSKTIAANIKEIFNIDIFTFLKCVGDDQTGSTHNQKEAILLILFMLCAGCEGNTKKILIGIEFLRKMYWPDQNISGYLNRSICNLISRDQNRTERVDKHTIPTSLITQLRKIKARGGNVDALHIIYNWTISNKCKFTSENNVITIPFEYIHARRERNGLGVLPLIGDFNNYAIQIAGNIPKLAVTNIPKNDNIGMSNDLLHFLKDKFDINIEREEQLLSNMRQKNLINIASPDDKKKWYEEINKYYSTIKFSEIEEKEGDIQLYGNILAKEIYFNICDIFENPELVKQYYNPMDVINSLIAKTEIKNYDVFNNLLMQVMQQRNKTKIQAMQIILEQYLHDKSLIELLSGAIQKCGIQLVMKILSDEIKYNSILEGYVRDTILVFIRSYVIYKLLIDEQLSTIIEQREDKLVEIMCMIELHIVNDDINGGIWKYVLP